MQSGERKVYLVAEDRWITINGTHLLVSDKGKILNDKMRKKIEGTSKNNGGGSKVKKEENKETRQESSNKARLQYSKVNKRYGGELIYKSLSGRYNWDMDKAGEFLDDIEKKSKDGSMPEALDKDELEVLRAMADDPRSPIHPDDREWINTNFRAAKNSKK